MSSTSNMLFYFQIQAATDELAAKVGVKVHELCMGVGDPPSVPS